MNAGTLYSTLVRYFALAGWEVKDACAQGRVTVNGAVCRHPDRILVFGDTVALDGEPCTV